MKHFIKPAAALLCLLVMFSFSVRSFAAVPGDADGSGTLTAADARLILRHAVGLESFTAQQAEICDLNTDGVIDSADARGALRLSVGLLPFGLSEEEKEQEKAAKLKELTLQLASKVNLQELSENMRIFCEETGARPTGSKALISAGQRIKNILVYNGFKESDISVQSFNYHGKTENIVAKIPTKAENPDIILFSAHYDSVKASPGAVDNASGVCSVLELSRILREMNTDFGFEIRFAFFSAEENGYVGAYQYITQTDGKQSDRHILVVNADMTGHPNDEKNYYLTVSTEPVTSSYQKEAEDNLGSIAIKRAKEILGAGSEADFVCPAAAGMHDIVPFRKNNIPALTLSWRETDKERAHGSDFNLAAPAVIHTGNDTLQNFDIGSLYSTTQLLAGCAADLYFNYTPKKADSSENSPEDSVSIYKVLPEVGLNMREKHSTDSAVITTLKQGEKIEIKEIFTDEKAEDEALRQWGLVEYNGKTGWLSMYYLQKVKAVPVE